MFKMTTNPVGEVKFIDQIEEYLNGLLEQWRIENPPTSWWRLWSKAKIGFVKITAFLLNAIDELIQLSEDLVDLGPDKKATVMDAISRLYDWIVKEALPIWLKPWSPAIKNFIINVVISYAIDWIVGKYNTGEFVVEGDPAKFRASKMKVKKVGHKKTKTKKAQVKKAPKLSAKSRAMKKNNG
tara:strand:+ start:9594 stop:10142 length:549 start_codon:yes stop_codon:yes gene_type:complete